MTESLEPASPEVVTEALTEQPADTKPIEVKPQASEEPAPEVKAEEPKEPKKKASREEVVKNAIDKATGKEYNADNGEKPPKDSEKKVAPEPVADKESTSDAPSDSPEPKPTAYKDPPKRFDDGAKAEWEAVPESVRGAVHRTVKEIEQGIEKYRTDAEAYEPIRKFDEMARNNGGNLAESIQKMVDLEAAFARNPVEGFLRVGQALNINIKDVAAKIAGMQPQQLSEQNTHLKMADVQRQNQMMQQQLAAIQQQQQMQQVQSQAVTEWESFKNSNPRAAELEADIADFLTKYPAAPDVPIRDRLADAYAFATAKNPKAAHTGEDPALAQTQVQRQANPKGQLSVAGSAKGDATSKKQKLSRSAAIKEAMRAHGAI